MKACDKMFSEEGSWFKGNLHSHTVNSDGRLTPAQSASYYREHGYSFLCLSEHDYYTDLREELDRDDFIILPGLEASTYLITSMVFLAQRKCRKLPVQMLLPQTSFIRSASI